MKNDEKEYNFEFSEILFLKNHPNMRKIEGEWFLQRSHKYGGDLRNKCFNECKYQKKWVLPEELWTPKN